jgi:hypothetical protein
MTSWVRVKCVMYKKDLMMMCHIFSLFTVAVVVVVVVVSSFGNKIVEHAHLESS